MREATIEAPVLGYADYSSCSRQVYYSRRQVPNDCYHYEQVVQYDPPYLTQVLVITNGE